MGLFSYETWKKNEVKDETFVIYDKLKCQIDIAKLQQLGRVLNWIFFFISVFLESICWLMSLILGSRIYWSKRLTHKSSLTQEFPCIKFQNVEVKKMV